MSQISIQQLYAQAARHQQAGDLRQAEILYRQILNHSPREARALHNLGLMAHQLGRSDLAVQWIGQAIEIQPTYGGWRDLGVVLRLTGQPHKAIEAFHRAIALKPGSASDYNNLGNAHKEAGQTQAATAAYQQAISIEPGSADAHANLGTVLVKLRRFDQGVQSLERAAALNPQSPVILTNFGNSLIESGDPDRAIEIFRRAIALAPNHADAYSGLGNALRLIGEIEQSEQTHRRSIVLNPQLPEPHFGLALVLLAQGKLAEGWEEYEWRWKCEAVRSPRRNFAQPMWDASPSHDRTLLIHAEQGFGDTLQFVRYLPIVRERVAKIILECQPTLVQLVESVSDGVTVIPQSSTLPPFDMHCPLLSLPKMFRTRLDSIPARVPYLAAAPSEIERWKRQVDHVGPGLKVGLVWAGNPLFSDDLFRSLKLEQLSPLATVEGVRYFSLQKGAAAEQLKSPPPGLELINWTEQLHTFSDTAALIANLDLIITSDTSVAHLAAALNRPTWLMLSHSPDWRWMLTGENCPWYPSVRLFRQTRRADWADVIRRVAMALQAVAKRLDGSPADRS
jgi:Tfp pilus assembly protein PilF